MSKQDRQGARTVEDLERRLNYGERFNEVMGVANDARHTAEEALQSVSDLTQEQVFNALTNNGEAEGLYRSPDGQVYINASYLRSGVITSENGAIKIDLSQSATQPVFNTGISTNGILIRGDAVDAKEVFDISVKNVDGRYVANLLMNNAEGYTIAQITEDVSKSGGGIILAEATGLLAAIAQASLGSAGFRLLRNGETKAYFGIDSTSSGLQSDWVQTTQINGKTVRWKDNGDGTYTLIGT